MSSFSENDAEEVVGCPYDKSHRMLRKRLQSHLLKCRLNYPNLELRKCPFNQTHLIPESEFAIHVIKCEGQKLVALYKYNQTEIKEEQDPRIKHEPIQCDDNWD